MHFIFAILGTSVGIILVTFGYLSATPLTNGGEIFEDTIEDENVKPTDEDFLEQEIHTTKYFDDNLDESSHETLVAAGGRLVSHSNDIGGSSFGSSYEFGYGSSSNYGTGGGSGGGSSSGSGGGLSSSHGSNGGSGGDSSSDGSGGDSSSDGDSRSDGSDGDSSSGDGVIDNPQDSEKPSSSLVGGNFMQIESTALVLAGIQTNLTWILLVILAVGFA